MNNEKTLVFIPTYNERENVEKICSEIIKTGLDLDILFLDDNSPDGTGILIDQLAEKYKTVKAMHRPGKMGIGSAHQYGIKFAYDQGYKNLITMDGDFAHSPEYLRRLIESSENYDIVVGSRYAMKNSLQGWNYVRKFLTLTGHFLTKYCLGIKYDATGAFRLYRLDRIPEHTFDLVASKGYSFFFESLFVLSINKFLIKELPIILPARIYGHSKMSLIEVFHSVYRLIRIYLSMIFNRRQYLVDKRACPAEEPATKEASNDWNTYWLSKKDIKGFIYDIVASFYRQFIIEPSFSYFISKHFIQGSELLHAGCGSGRVDKKINKKFSITALDNSISALNIYRRFNKDSGKVIYGDICATPFNKNSFDGIYNLGVMEHFTEEDIGDILSEFHRILKSEGRLIIFWPPIFGISVIFLKSLRCFMMKMFKKDFRLHPDEITLVESKDQVSAIFERANFKITEYYFGSRDFFTYVVIVAEKANLFKKQHNDNTYI